MSNNHRILGGCYLQNSIDSNSINNIRKHKKSISSRKHNHNKNHNKIYPCKKNQGKALHIINFAKNCISSTQRVAYHRCDSVCNLRLIICTFGDDIQPTADDMPSLSQCIKNRLAIRLTYFLAEAEGFVLAIFLTKRIRKCYVRKIASVSH